MSSLVNVTKVNQKELLAAYDFAIAEKENILVLGPSGAGKTEMGFQACQKNGSNAIYWNMSVMERPDIQGLPALSTDKKTASFAPHEGMPFLGLDAIKRERKLQFIIDSLREHNSELAYFVQQSTKELEGIRKEQAIQVIKECADIFDADKIKSLGIDTGIVGNENSKNTLYLDEIDKTPPENLQPLLELLLYRSINGRPLDIQSVIMTGNLPDEHTYSEPLSHAITNRGIIFELVPDWEVWLNWAKKACLHPLVLGFLSREENSPELNKRPVNNMHCYSYTSPRAWTRLSGLNYKLDRWFGTGRMLNGKPHPIDGMRRQMNASVVGDEAAAKLEVWTRYYAKHADLIDRVWDGGNDPAPSNEENDQENFAATIVVAMALSTKFGVLTRSSDDTPGVQKKAAHIFKWIHKNTPADVKTAAFRSCYDFDEFTKHSLQSFPETKAMFQEMVESYNAINSYQQKDKL